MAEYKTSPYVQLSSEQEEAIIVYYRNAQAMLWNQFQIRTQMQYIDCAYMREQSYTEDQIKSRIANMQGNPYKIQDMIVPVVMPQVEAALGYVVNVFLTGYPIFGVSADPTNQDSAMQLETVIAENSITARWARQLMMFFRDGFKYNLHALEVAWDRKTVYSIENDLKMPNSAKPKKTLWWGNILKRMDLYNTFFDPRVHPADMHEQGEFAGYIEMFNEARLKQLCNDITNDVKPTVITRALESSLSGGGMTNATQFNYFIPFVNPLPLMNIQNQLVFNWMNWAQNNAAGTKQVHYPGVYQVAKMYARIIPAKFGLSVPEANTPQVWMFRIINGTVILTAERLNNAHNYLPILFGQPLEDGLDFQTKSFASNVTDLQAISSALMNGYIQSKRRLVGDRVLYDPMRIRQKDIESTNPVAKIPVRPSAYGQEVGKAVYQFPFRDEQTNSMLQGAADVVTMADKVNNQNPAQQGQFVKGNKTRQEFGDIMAHGNMRNQVMAMMTENQVFVPLKEIIKLNILQYQGDAVLLNQSAKSLVTIKPETLRATAAQFKMSDGILPQSKLMASDEFQTVLQVLGSSQELMQRYNIAPMFSYVMKQRGLDLSPFEKTALQVEWEKQLAQWQQVAAEAIQKGQQIPPQPTMPPELIAELKQLQQQGGVTSPTTQATQNTLAGTQGDSNG